MDKPLVLIDFDGVINQFPDEKVLRRQNSVDWTKPDDPRRELYAPDNWFQPDCKAKVLVQGMDRRIRIRWSSGLVDRLKALDAEICWLSTWQPYTGLLNADLDVDWKTIDWYDPVTRQGIWTGKRRSVLNALEQNRPIVWLDDEETTPEAENAIRAVDHSAPVLAVGPNSAIGISCSQMDLIEDFVKNPVTDSMVRFVTAFETHEGHMGF